MATLATLTIPLMTVPVWTEHVLGPVAIPIGTTWAKIALDRTAGLQSLSSLTTATVVKIALQSSQDRGVSWENEAAVTVIGGPSPSSLAGVFVSPINGDPASATRLARAVMSTTDVLTIAGTLTAGS